MHMCENLTTWSLSHAYPSKNSSKLFCSFFSYPMGSQTAHTVWRPSAGLILAPVPTPASAQVANTVGSQNTRSIIHRKSPGVDYCNSLLYIVHEATRALLLLGQKSLPVRLHATTVFRCKLKNTPRFTYIQTDRSNFITHSLTSRPSSMTVGDCR